MCVSRQRWPGRVAAGAVTDEIVADVDWLPTLASMVGESARVPDDRPIDGIEVDDVVTIAGAALAEKSSRPVRLPADPATSRRVNRGS